MKVLQLAAYDAPFFREQIKVLRQNGIECDVLIASNMTLNNDPDSLVEKAKSKLAGQHLPYYAYCTFRFYPKLLYKAFTENYDIIHFNSGMIAPFVWLQPEQPVVLTLWGDGLIGDRLYGQFDKICQFSSNQSDAVIVRSEEMRQALNCDSYIMPSGVDLEKFSPIDQTRAQQKVGWDASAKHVLFPYKKSRPKKRYPVAKRVVESLSESLNEDVKIQVVHGKPHSEISDYMNAADALILPSTMEGSPNTIKEALACNTPIVTTNVGDVEQRLDGVDNSFVCSNENELLMKLETIIDKGERSNGRQKVREVSLENMGEQLEKIYYDTINFH